MEKEKVKKSAGASDTQKKMKADLTKLSKEKDQLAAENKKLKAEIEILKKSAIASVPMLVESDREEEIPKTRKRKQVVRESSPEEEVVTSRPKRYIKEIFDDAHFEYSSEVESVHRLGQRKGFSRNELDYRTAHDHNSFEDSFQYRSRPQHTLPERGFTGPSPHAHHSGPSTYSSPYLNMHMMHGATMQSNSIRRESPSMTSERSLAEHPMYRSVPSHVSTFLPPRGGRQGVVPEHESLYYHENMYR